MEAKDLEALLEVLKSSLVKAVRGQLKVGLSFLGHFARLGAAQRGKHNSIFAVGTQMDSIQAMHLC